MYCCSACFKNNEVQTNIVSISQFKGDCNYCGATNLQVIDAREIVEFFQPVINLYEVSDIGDKLLPEILQTEWEIFNINTQTATKLLKDMFAEVKSVNPDIFNLPVINKTHNHIITEGLIKQWDELKVEIVKKNRFFLENVIDLDSLEKYLNDKSKTYKTGELFYRGRRSRKEGYPLTELGKPPVEKSTAGRANPQGIPYLYLSTDEKTTLYEARASYFDYVTIGTFRLQHEIKIVKLRTVEIFSPFEEEIFNKLVYQPFLQSLERDLSKPLRRFDSDLDYLPTQYLCEFIKHIGFDGVEYGSAMNRSGVNLAIFDDAKFECFECKIVEVKNIEIEFHEVNLITL